MNEYLLNGETYAFDYQDLKRKFEMYESMSDEEFVADLPNVLHFAVFVCWFKRIPAYGLLSDVGLVHELVHVLALGKDGGDRPDSTNTTWLGKVRALFNDTCRIS